MEQMDLQVFATETQTTNLAALSDEMKTYYEKRLIDNAEPNLVHDQFGDKYPIPEGSGKTIEFRRYSPLPKALTAITEGVTPVPDGDTGTRRRRRPAGGYQARSPDRSDGERRRHLYHLHGRTLRDPPEGRRRL